MSTLDDITPEQLKYWADEYLKGTINPEDKARFEAWYNSLPGDAISWTDENEDSAESLRTAMLAEIQRRMSADVPKGSKIFRLRRPVAAAIFLLLAATGIYFMMNRHRSRPVQPVSGNITPENHDIPPGGNKASLTLANGAVILLDSAANGTLTRQGSTVITQSAGGQIIYQNGTMQNSPSEVLYNILATPRGGEYRLTLPDGSRVWLDAQSSIRYPVAFTGKERKVKVTGEVYFEVAENAGQPFIVNVDDRADIRVLGTHFNVMAYREENLMRTTLLEGKIRITTPNKSSPARTLLPGEQAVIDPSGDITTHKGVDVETAVAWKNNYFVFHNSTLQDVMRQLARWYNIDVEYNGSNPVLLNGRFKRSNNLSTALKILQTAADVKFNIEGRKVIIGK